MRKTAKKIVDSRTCPGELSLSCTYGSITKGGVGGGGCRLIVAISLPPSVQPSVSLPPPLLLFFLLGSIAASMALGQVFLLSQLRIGGWLCPFIHPLEASLPAPALS